MLDVLLYQTTEYKSVGFIMHACNIEMLNDFVITDNSLLSSFCFFYFRCASPPLVSGEHIFSVNDDIFDCVHRYNLSGFIIGIICVIFLTVIGSIVLFTCIIRKRHHPGAGKRIFANGIPVTNTSTYSRVQDSRELFESCVESNIS